MLRKGPATDEYLRQYDKNCKWVNDLFAKIDAGKITADNLQPTQRAKMRQVMKHQIALEPATMSERTLYINATQGRAVLPKDLNLLVLPDATMLYRVYGAELIEGFDWAWSSTPDGRLGLLLLTPFDLELKREGDANPAVQHTIHTWSENGSRMDEPYLLYIDMLEDTMLEDAREMNREFDAHNAGFHAATAPAVREWVDLGDGRRDALRSIQERARAELQEARRRARAAGIEESLFDKVFGPRDSELIRAKQRVEVENERLNQDQQALIRLVHQLRSERDEAQALIDQLVEQGFGLVQT
jgi:hypothetical protein